jgi:hypothetical protein
MTSDMFWRSRALAMRVALTHLTGAFDDEQRVLDEIEATGCSRDVIKWLVDELLNWSVRPAEGGVELYDNEEICRHLERTIADALGHL